MSQELEQDGAMRKPVSTVRKTEYRLHSGKTVAAGDHSWRTIAFGAVPGKYGLKRHLGAIGLEPTTIAVARIQFLGALSVTGACAHSVQRAIGRLDSSNHHRRWRDCKDICDCCGDWQSRGLRVSDFVLLSLQPRRWSIRRVGRTQQGKFIVFAAPWRVVGTDTYDS